MQTPQYKSHLLVLGFLLVFTTVVWLLYFARSPSPEIISTDSSNRSIQAAPELKLDLQAREKAADNTFWAKEILAQDCGRTFETFWNSLHASSNKLDLIAAFPLSEII